MFAVETKGLTKIYNAIKAVDSLDLKVPVGSVYGFLGPNGAGKTTTIRMLTGLANKTSGDIRICGREVRFGSVKNKADIGYLPDVPGFYEWMTAPEYIRFSGDMLGLPRKTIQSRSDELLGLVGLGTEHAGIVKKRIGSYSRGMKQRLGIAQALISEPKVLFLDEPTSALDPIGRKEVIDIIGKLSGKVTVFFSTHILSDVERICDRVVILDKGKVLAEDTMENLKKSYSVSVFSVTVEKGRGHVFTDAVKRQPWVKEIRVADIADTAATDIAGKDITRTTVADKDITDKDITRTIVADKDITRTIVADKDITDTDITDTAVADKDIADANIFDADECLVYVSDVVKAQREIPAIISQKGIGLVRFIPVEPTLEDIFIKLVNE